MSRAYSGIRQEHPGARSKPPRLSSALLLSGSAPDAPRRRNRRSACQSLTQPRPPQPPPHPFASQRDVVGAAAHAQEFNQHTTGATSTTPPRSQPALAFDSAPASRRRYAITKSNVREQSARQSPRHPPACHAACFARPSSHAPPLRVIERPPRNQRPQQFQRPRSRYVRAQTRCSSRASLPLTPRLARLLQPLECALPLIQFPMLFTRLRSEATASRSDAAL